MLRPFSVGWRWSVEPLMQPEADPMPPARRNLGELVLALTVVVLGAGVVWQTTQIRLTPAYSQVGPRAIPYIVGLGLVIVGLWLAAEALTGRATAVSADAEDADPTLPTDWRTVGLLALPLVVYLVLIERAGFVVASAVLYGGAAFAMGSRRYARDAAIGVVMAVVLFEGFTRGLDLRLPAGVLDGVL